MPQTLILQSHPNYQLLCDQRTAWSKQNTHIILFELCATYINLFTLCTTFGGNSVVGNLTFITALQICQAMITSFMNRDFCAKLQQISIPFLTQRVACKPQLQTEIDSCAPKNVKLTLVMLMYTLYHCIIFWTLIAHIICMKLAEAYFIFFLKVPAYTQYMCISGIFIPPLKLKCLASFSSCDYLTTSSISPELCRLKTCTKNGFKVQAFFQITNYNFN